MNKEKKNDDAWIDFIEMMVMLMLFFGAAPCAHAEETIKTTLTFRNDIVDPDQGEGYAKQYTTIHLQGKRLGGGVDMFTTPEKDFLALKPYITAKTTDTSNLIVGLLSNSKGEDFIQAGVWYYPSVGGFNLFFDARGFEAVSEEAEDFLDAYLGIGYPVGKFTVGLDLVYDRFWQSKSDYYMAGLPLSYRLTEKLKLFVRPTADSFVPQNGRASRSQSVRTGFQLNF